MRLRSNDACNQGFETRERERVETGNKSVPVMKTWSSQHISDVLSSQTEKNGKTMKEEIVTGKHTQPN